MTYQPDRNSVRAIGYATVAGPASPGARILGLRHSGTIDYRDGVRSNPAKGAVINSAGRPEAMQSATPRASPSRSFIELTRNIELAEQAPRRFEPTVKAPNDIVI